MVGYCAFIDAEHALDPAFAEAIGVKTENMLLSQPDCGEHALSLVDILVRSGSVDVVVVDSVAALVPKSELDGEVGDAHIALQARLMSQALRKLSHSLSCSQTILVFVNQVRAKLSTFSGFGAPSEVTCGGNALKFYASVRLNTRRVGFIKKGEEVVGTQIQVKVVKNKHAPPFKTVQLELEFGKGISRDSEVIDLGCKHKLIIKAGTSYYAIGDRNFHGKDAIKQYFHENKSVREELMIKIREKMLHKEVPGNNLESDLSDGRESEEEVVTEVEA
ncbi:RecA family protein [Rhynchospora pubera]|uniref:RecA family protein n=1 Tax=Rhynchospora pubera TaxID=906938 RepID=A0AAV8CAS0_9POAL|nr:RecA family protein [Rhynchospora pubera]